MGGLDLFLLYLSAIHYTVQQSCTPQHVWRPVCRPVNRTFESYMHDRAPVSSPFSLFLGRCVQIEREKKGNEGQNRKEKNR